MNTEVYNLSKEDSLISDNEIISVIIRTHKETRLPFLDETLFSLAIQEWKDIELVVVLQNGTKEFEEKVMQLIKKHPFSDKIKIQIHSLSFPNNIDGRSTLLNYGIKCSVGRYISFLDDDDFVYQHGYKTLINQLKDSNCPIVIGGCRTAHFIKEKSNTYIKKKENPFTWGGSKFDLINDNFIPIHSYVIDKTRCNISDLKFDESFTLLEDYEFLLRFASKYEFDFSKFETIVCEYRVHLDNSLPFVDKIPENHREALNRINEKKKQINFQIPIDKLKLLLDTQKYSLKLNGENEHEQIAISISKTHDNPQIIRRILNTTGDKIYEFFETRPSLEKKASKLIHYFGNEKN